MPDATARKRIVLDADERPGPFGRAPAERTIDKHLRLGLVVLDKPAGPTSHQVAHWVKEATGLPKVGHGGTLDPNVTGVLPIALADATRLIKVSLESDKEYVGVLRLHGPAPAGDVERVFKEFTGPIWQIPPLKSAVARRLRERTIHDLRILETAEKDILFRVSCESGTYIRKLCADIGLALGVGGNMRALRRTRTAGFDEGDVVTMQDLRDAMVFWKEDGDESGLRRIVRPIEDLLAPLPAVTIRDSAVDAVCHGAGLAAPGVVAADAAMRKGDLVAVMTHKGEAVAIGVADVDAGALPSMEGGIALRVERVVMAPGTYPRGWKRRAIPSDSPKG